MGQNHCNLKVTASVSVQGKGCPVDGITLSYVRRRPCCGRKRRLVAAFTFPRHGWRQVSSGDTRHNTSSKAAVVPLDRLRKKDGSTAVQVSCMSDGVPVYRTEVTVADLLQRLDLTTRGKEAAVFFSLSGGKTEEGNTQAHTFTALFCNGKRCGDGGAATPADTPHRRHEQPGKEADEQIGEMEDKESHSLQSEEKEFTVQEMAVEAPKATSPCSYDGSGEESSEEEAFLGLDPVHQVERLKLQTEFDKFEAATSSDWTCEEDEEVEDDDGMEQEEEEEKQEEEKFCRVNEGPPTHSGDCPQWWRGSLGYITSVAAVMLVFYNAWLEYSRD